MYYTVFTLKLFKGFKKGLAVMKKNIKGISVKGLNNVSTKGVEMKKSKKVLPTIKAGTGISSKIISGSKEVIDQALANRSRLRSKRSELYDLRDLYPVTYNVLKDMVIKGKKLSPYEILRALKKHHALA